MLLNSLFRRFQAGLGGPIIAIALLAASGPSAAAESVAECRLIEGDAARLACYDRVLAPEAEKADEKASSVSPATSETPKKASSVASAASQAQEAEPPTAPAAEAARQSAGTSSAAAPAPARETEKPAAAEYESLSDEIGSETLKGSEDRERVSVRGRVVECREQRSGKYVFYFANGQIWQQKDSTRVSWRDCSFEVTITKDFFGYRMTRDGEKRRIRIARIK